MKIKIKLFIQIFAEILLIPYIFFKALLARYKIKSIDLGLGPQPLINNVYHKKALEKYGYTVETFVSSPFYITKDFDIVLSNIYNVNSSIGRFKAYLHLIDLSFKYKILYFYFYGGPIGVSTKLLWRVEYIFYKIGQVKTVVMPYGSDVQEMSRSRNLYFKHTLNIDYNSHKLNRVNTAKRINIWTTHADHVISGCDWVDYMYAWDTLMIAHFSIDCNKFDKLESKINSNNSLKIFHAPNHKAIKGSEHLISAIEELKEVGYEIELIMLSKVSNQEILETLQSVDIVADQFVIGWYAMFALEAMSLGKPVMCYLREDLIDLYTKSNLIKKDEIPIINTNILNIKEKIIWAYENKEQLSLIGVNSKEYVKKHHSLESVGKVFDKINKDLLENT